MASEKFHTQYDNLRVSRNAPEEVIRAAYRALAQKYHPDVNADTDASRIMSILNQSYAVLSDVTTRAAHDSWIAAMESTTNTSPPTRENGPHVRWTVVVLRRTRTREGVHGKDSPHGGLLMQSPLHTSFMLLNITAQSKRKFNCPCRRRQMRSRLRRLKSNQESAPQPFLRHRRLRLPSWFHRRKRRSRSLLLTVENILSLRDISTVILRSGAAACVP